MNTVSQKFQKPPQTRLSRVCRANASLPKHAYLAFASRMHRTSNTLISCLQSKHSLSVRRVYSRLAQTRLSRIREANASLPKHAYLPFAKRMHRTSNTLISHSRSECIAPQTRLSRIREANASLSVRRTV